jgi:hypothetical protein
MNRRQHPQVIRATELALAAGLDPYAEVECKGHWRSKAVYETFMDAAFDEHFANVAIDNIYWDQGGSWLTDQWDIPRRKGDCNFHYGRCKSGNRWFWHVGGWVIGHAPDADNFNEHGYSATEAEALAAGTEAIKRLAAGRRGIVHLIHGTASDALKQLNKAKREARWAAQPSSTKNSNAVEYLYGHTRGGEITDGHPVRFRITKKTAKRIFYLQQEEEINTKGEPVVYEHIHNTSDTDDHIGFVDRQKLEATGEVHNNARHWCYADFHLYASLQGLLSSFHRYSQANKDRPSILQLKAEMAAAHPDRGGSNAAFIEARKRYIEARRRIRSEAAK